MELSRRAAIAAPPGNSLLAHLPGTVREAIVGAGTVRRLRRGQAVFPRRERWDAAYFPFDTIISALALLREGGEVEVDSMGREGLLGLHVAFEAQPLRGEAVCQLSGDALYVPGSGLRAIVGASPELRRLLVRHALARINVLRQSSACHAAHGAVQRSARWLLYSRDRAGRDQFDLTQDFLAMMLGLRRATVTVALAELQDRGAIRIARGWMEVRDPDVLHRAACECYDVVRQEYESVFR